MNDQNIEKHLRGKRVFVTGDSGFTGRWASVWLEQIGAEVIGYSLEPKEFPNLFGLNTTTNQSNLIVGDIADYQTLFDSMRNSSPDLVLHLAAQPLVRKSYREPLKTFLTNAQGTANVLNAARSVSSVVGIVCVTTDKVYKQKVSNKPFKEKDELGGEDPYSASKVSAEAVINSYMKMESVNQNRNLRISIARGGNIIGGGDWSEDRLVPDFVRALVNKKVLTIRSPKAVRPWQHVLALVEGYLYLLAGLSSNHPATFEGPWNFGPIQNDILTVEDLISEMAYYWDRPRIEYVDNSLPETEYLCLDSSKAMNKLHWRPVWNTQKSIEMTISWYRSYFANAESTHQLTMNQITEWRRSQNELFFDRV